jgi:MoxR-like ATPase
MDAAEKATAPVVDVADARKRLQKIEVALGDHSVERERQVRAMLLAFVMQEHCFLVGPPGCNKSGMIEGLAQCLEVPTRYVRKLYHAFMTPDESVGPMNLQDFQKLGVFRRNLEGGVCAAEIVFGDEVFKGNAAQLNTHLTLLNEREYEMLPIPLRSFLAASNEFPSDKSLGALYDRFLVRDQLGYIVSKRKLRNLLRRVANQPKSAQKFVPPCMVSLDEWDAITASMETVFVPDAVIDKFMDLCSKLASAGIIVSDRRKVQSMRVLKASAWLEGEKECGVDDLQALQFVLWDNKEEQEQLVAVLNALDRSNTSKAIGMIDDVLRAFSDRPTGPTDCSSVEEYREQIGAVEMQILNVAEQMSKQMKDGAFSKRGIEKIKRRASDLKEARQACKDEIAATVGAVMALLS